MAGRSNIWVARPNFRVYDIDSACSLSHLNVEEMRETSVDRSAFDTDCFTLVACAVHVSVQYHRGFLFACIIQIMTLRQAIYVCQNSQWRQDGECLGKCR
jgi:hypothetical protein